MTLPPPIQTYFSARSPEDAEAFAAAFAPEAVVRDEGAIRQGPEEISAWWRAAKARYRHTSTPLDLHEAAGKTLVRARVSGDFPGSPLVLTFRFALDGDRISELEITA